MAARPIPPRALDWYLALWHLPCHSRLALAWGLDMRLLVLGLALLLAGCAASPDRPACDRALVSAAMKSLAPVSRPKVVEDINRRKTVRVVSIHEDGLGSHQYKYSAVVDLDANAVWLARYGGIIDRIDWFGPLAVPVSRVAACPDSRLSIVLSAAR